VGGPTIQVGSAIRIVSIKLIVFNRHIDNRPQLESDVRQKKNKHSPERVKHRKMQSEAQPELPGILFVGVNPGPAAEEHGQQDRNRLVLRLGIVHRRRHTLCLREIGLWRARLIGGLLIHRRLISWLLLVWRRLIGLLLIIVLALICFWSLIGLSGSGSEC
jgi:hypothetical protein